MVEHGGLTWRTAWRGRVTPWVVLGIFLGALALAGGSAAGPSSAAGALASTDQLVFIANGRTPGQITTQIWTMAADGSNQAQAPIGGIENKYDPTWTSDGAAIIYAAFETHLNQNLYVANPDGSGKRQLTTSVDGDSVEPAASPDGLTVAFTRRYAPPLGGKTECQIMLINLDGRNERALTPREPQGCTMHPTWSPDSRRVAFTSLLNGRWTIAIVNTDGSGLIYPGIDGTDPAWSPDGTRLAYTGITSAGWVLQTATTDGLARTTVLALSFSEGLGRPDWSPTGSEVSFTYASFAASIPERIDVISSDGSSRRTLTTQGNNLSARWRPRQTPPPSTTQCVNRIKWNRINLTYSYEGRGRYADVARDAVAAWNNLGTPLVVLPAKKGDIVFTDIDDATRTFYGDTSAAGLKKIELGQAYTSSPPNALSPKKVTIKVNAAGMEQLDRKHQVYVLTHELGHALGLAHSNQSVCNVSDPSIMNSGAEDVPQRTVITIQPYDRMNLEKLYGFLIS